MNAYLWIALGSALGGMARYACTGLVADWWGSAFPWGTVLVNITGSAIIGFVSALDSGEREILALEVRQFLIPGLCGGYTTFSAFSQQTLNLLHQGRVVAAGANVGLSVVLCLIAVWLGHLGGAAVASRGLTP